MTLTQEAIAKLWGRAAQYKITASRLAEASGLSRVTLSNWRNDRNRPTLEAFLQVESALEQLIKDQSVAE